MRALVLTAPQRFQISPVPFPALQPDQIRLRPRAVGICGTDFHIYAGQANYNYDASGYPIPLEQSPQVLGHEIEGEILEAGRDVRGLRPGERVIVDQGWNCYSQNRRPLCEYCASGDSHQCAYYREQGISGLPGGLAETLVAPACNVIAVDAALAPDQGALVEPLACVLHSSQRMEALPARFQWRGPHPIRSVLILGAGPTGLLFLQYLRRVLGFEGRVLVSEPNPAKRRLVAVWGGEALDPAAQPLTAAVLERTAGQGVEYLIEAAGNGPLFREIPGLIRKQATILLFGHGHDHAGLGLLNPIQFKEASLVTGAGASGGFDAAGRPLIYQQALRLLAEGVIQTAPLITHFYDGLEAVPRAFESDCRRGDYIKGIARLNR